MPRAGQLGRADVGDLDRDGPDAAFLVLEHQGHLAAGVAQVLAVANSSLMTCCV